MRPSIAHSTPLAAPCSVCRTFSLPQKEPQSPWADLNFSESGWDPSVPSSPIALEINDSTSLFCGESPRQPPTHHRAESHGHADEREAIQSISWAAASCWPSVLQRAVNDQSRKCSGPSTFGPTEIFWGKPMPGTANHRGLGELWCMIFLPSTRMRHSRAWADRRTEYAPQVRLCPWGRPESF
jgi:hypothetical protein